MISSDLSVNVKTISNVSSRGPHTCHTARFAARPGLFWSSRPGLLPSRLGLFGFLALALEGDTTPGEAAGLSAGDRGAPTMGEGVGRAAAPASLESSAWTNL